MTLDSSILGPGQGIEKTIIQLNIVCLSEDVNFYEVVDRIEADTKIEVTEVFSFGYACTITAFARGALPIATPNDAYKPEIITHASDLGITDEVNRFAYTFICVSRVSNPENTDTDFSVVKLMRHNSKLQQRTVVN